MKILKKIIYPVNIIISLVIVAALILSMVMKQYQLLFIIIGLASVIILFAFITVFHILSQKERKVETQAVIEVIDKYQNNQKVVIEDIHNKYLKEIATAISTLSIKGQTIANKYFYDMDNFIHYVDSHIDYNSLSKLAYIHMSNVVDIHDLLDKYDYVYINKDKDGISLMVLNFANKKNIENSVHPYANENNDVFIIYYPDYSLSDFIRIDKLEASIKEDHFAIYDKKNNPYKLNNFYSLVNEITLKDDKEKIDVYDFILKAMRYLPFSNVALDVNGHKEYFKWSDKEDFLAHEREEYEYYQDVELYHRDDNRLSVTLAGYNSINNISNEQQLVIDSFLNTLLVIYLPKFLHTLDRATERRIYERMRNLRGYSYVVNNDYDIISASENLKNKFKEDIIGKKCYSALFGRKEACKSCPKLGKDVVKHISKIGTNSYDFTAYDNGEETQVNFIESHHEILNREALEETMLDQINNEKHGYVMVFKIDYLSDLAIKHKVDKKAIIDEFINILKAYSLDGSLYRKDIDEFAYVLENARYADCVEIAKKLSFAFEDKISLNDNGVLLTPKIILLSYPLEINSLFALDSLSRTLFKAADKRGKLYRLAIDPVYVNRKREYLEIIEQSLKDDKIPVAYREIKDKDNKENILDVRFNYFDKDHNRIQEDTLTLYAKLEGFYFPILERVFKSVEYDKNHKYVFYFGKEAIDNSLFATVINELNAMKIPLKQVIIISEELYLSMNKEVVKKYADVGLEFALSNIESNTPYDLPVKVKFARINKAKFLDNKQYALKVLALRNMGIDLASHEEIEGVEVRYKG